jgi:hypothetical protein
LIPIFVSQSKEEAEGSSKKHKCFFEKSRIMIKGRISITRGGQMKKIFIILAILLIHCPILSADLLTAYKKGEIAIVPDPGFGAKAGADKLLVAYSKSPEISIYSFSGQKLSSFYVDIEPQKIKWDHLEYAGDTTSEDQASREMFHKFITMNKDKILLPEFHQLYLALTVDSESHILLYLNNLAQKSQDIAFLAYSLDGKLLCKTKIKAGEFEPVRPSGFYKNYCYATLTRKSDGSQFLARIKLSD